MAEKVDITTEEARSLVADAALWPRVRDFLWDFAPQIHSSWIAGLGILDRLDGLDGSEMLKSPRIKRLVLSSLGVEPCFHTFPKDDWSRILLLDGAVLESIVKWLGALVLSDELRHVTDGKTVRELKASFPGVYPEVFSYTAYFKEWKSAEVGKWKSGKAEGMNISDAVFEIGREMLSSALSKLPDSLVRRLVLKLPASSTPPPIRPSAHPPFHYSTSLPRLLKLKFPEAYSLCC